MAPKPTLTVERLDLSRILGVSVRHLAQLEAEGVIIPLRRGRGGRASTYAIEAVIPAYLAHVTQAPGTGAEREARRRRDLAQAKFTELKIAREEGDLLPREEVILAGQQQVKAWSAKIRVLPRQLVQAGIVSRESEGKIAGMLRSVLAEISEWQPVKDKRSAGQSR